MSIRSQKNSIKHRPFHNLLDEFGGQRLGSLVMARHLLENLGLPAPDPQCLYQYPIAEWGYYSYQFSSICEGASTKSLATLQTNFDEGPKE
jgi:hypothetical protein